MNRNHQVFLAGDFGANQKLESSIILCVYRTFQSEELRQKIRQKKKKVRVAYTTRTQFLLQTKSLVETINTSTGVNQLLLAGIERVALGADFNTDLLLGGAGGEGVAASAADGGLLVLRMDAFSHVVHLFLVS